jgi:hypothetical protein
VEPESLNSCRRPSDIGGTVQRVIEARGREQRCLVGALLGGAPALGDFLLLDGDILPLCLRPLAAMSERALPLLQQSPSRPSARRRASLAVLTQAPTAASPTVDDPPKNELRCVSEAALSPARGAYPPKSLTGSWKTSALKLSPGAPRTRRRLPRFRWVFSQLRLADSLTFFF